MNLRAKAGLLALCLWAFPLLAAERAFPTLVVVGGAEPLGSDEAIATPILVVDHESRDPEHRQFNLFLRTSLLKARWTSPWGSNWTWGPELDLHFIAAGDPSQAYNQGRLEPGSNFASNRLGAQLWLSTQGGWGDFGIAPLVGQWMFVPSPLTGKRFQLPQNLTEQGLLVRWTWQAQQGSWQQQLTADASEINRSSAGEWQWDQGQARQLGSQVLKGEISHEDASTLAKLKAAQAGGHDLDFLSAHQAGGLTGDFPLIGFYRNEFRATRLTWGEASLKAKWGKANGGIFVQSARIRRYESPLYQGMEAEYLVSSAGLALFSPLESLYGMPLILQLGQPLALPPGFDRDNPRLEVMIALAAGF